MLTGLLAGGLLVAALALIARAFREDGRAPLPAMTAPGTGPFPRGYARRAVRERRRVWIRYRDPRGEVIERTVEIYRTSLTGHISGWCRAQRSRCTFRRDRILAWQLLNQTFTRSDEMQGWSRWQGWYERMRELRGSASRH